MLWRKDFGAEHALGSIQVDPTDWRHVCLCGAKGSIIVLRMLNLARDKVEQQTYKVDMSASKPGDTLRCCFSTTRDLLYVLLPREVTTSVKGTASDRTGRESGTPVWDTHVLSDMLGSSTEKKSGRGRVVQTASLGSCKFCQAERKQGCLVKQCLLLCMQ